MTTHPSPHCLSPLTVKTLQELAHERFAANRLTQAQFAQFRQELLSVFGMDFSGDFGVDCNQSDFSKNTTQDAWFLLGTDGCHLCEIAHSTLAQAKAVRTLPSVHSLDIAEIHTPELAELMIDTLGRSIPVLLTANALLCYPFGVMDILAQN